MAAPERAGAFSPSAAATVPGGPVLIGLAAAVMAGGRAALAYMADIAAVVLFAAALLALLRTFLGPLPAGAAFLVTGALGLCLRRLMAAYTPSLLMEMGAEGLFFVVIDASFSGFSLLHSHKSAHLSVFAATPQASSAVFAESFHPIHRFGKLERHKVFLLFPSLVLSENLLPNALDEGCGLALV